MQRMFEQRIQQQFFDSADLKYQAAEVLAKPVAEAARALLGAITSGGKVMLCGSGGGTALALHMQSLLVGRFERDRPPLAAWALACDNTLPLAKQVQALGQPGDVLLVIDDATADNTAVLAALAVAHAKDINAVVLAGAQTATGAPWRELMTEADVLVAVPHERPSRILELHLLVLHCLCDALDVQLMGEQEN